MSHRINCALLHLRDGVKLISTFKYQSFMSTCQKYSKPSESQDFALLETRGSRNTRASVEVTSWISTSPVCRPRLWHCSSAGEWTGNKLTKDCDVELEGELLRSRLSTVTALRTDRHTYTIYGWLSVVNIRIYNLTNLQQQCFVLVVSTQMFEYLEQPYLRRRRSRLRDMRRNLVDTDVGRRDLARWRHSEIWPYIASPSATWCPCSSRHWMLRLYTGLDAYDRNVLRWRGQLDLRDTTRWKLRSSSGPWTLNTIPQCRD